jgi:hypothetical protein
MSQPRPLSTRRPLTSSGEAIRWRLDTRSGHPGRWVSGNRSGPPYRPGVAARRRKTVHGTWTARVVFAALAAAAAFLGAYGFATTLGSSTTGLGAGSEVVASCGSGLTFAFTAAFSATNSEYVVDGIELSNIPAGCQRKSLSASFYDSNGTTVGSTVDATLTASGSTESIAIAPSSNTIDAGQVNGVSVVVS